MAAVNPLELFAPRVDPFIGNHDNGAAVFSNAVRCAADAGGELLRAENGVKRREGAIKYFLARLADIEDRMIRWEQLTEENDYPVPTTPRELMQDYKDAQFQYECHLSLLPEDKDKLDRIHQACQEATTSFNRTMCELAGIPKPEECQCDPYIDYRGLRQSPKHVRIRWETVVRIGDREYPDYGIRTLFESGVVRSDREPGLHNLSCD